MFMKSIIATIMSVGLFAVAVVASNNMFNQHDANSESVVLAAMSFQNSGDMQKTASLESSYESLNNEGTCGQYSSYSCSSSCSSTCSSTCSTCCSHKCGMRRGF